MRTPTDRSVDSPAPTVPRRFDRALWAGAACLLASASLLAACGDDDSEPTAEEAFCQAGDDLRTNVTALADFDLISGGTDALEEQLTTIGDDIEALKSSGAEVASDQIDALETAYGELESAVEAAGDEITVDSATGVAAAVQQTATAAADFYTVVDTTCS